MKVTFLSPLRKILALNDYQTVHFRWRCYSEFRSPSSRNNSSSCSSNTNNKALLDGSIITAKHWHGQQNWQRNTNGEREKGREPGLKCRVEIEGGLRCRGSVGSWVVVLFFDELITRTDSGIKTCIKHDQPEKEKIEAKSSRQERDTVICNIIPGTSP